LIQRGLDSIRVDAFASVTSRLALQNPVPLARACATDPGTVVIVRALGENSRYPDLEITDGSCVPVRRGRIIAGALGSRQALRGFVGHPPATLARGDRLHLLNLGGVIGQCVDAARDVGAAIPVEVLGCAGRGDTIINIRDAAIPEVRRLSATAPIVLVLGSCMNVGKTAATLEIIRGLVRRGLRVGAGKVSGVGCLRDTRRMQEAGATSAYNFVDCGMASTAGAEDLSPVARRIAARLDADGVDAMVLELGDGLLGHYGVAGVLEDRKLLANVDAVVFCAADLVSAWGGRELLARRGVRIDVVSGPATDNMAGSSYIESELGLAAANALSHPDTLAGIVSGCIEAKVRTGRIPAHA
jgi:hypothetical protein